MKLFKLIMNCVIACLLVLSVLSNIFILSILGIKNGEDFKQVMVARELLNGFQSVDDTDEPEASEPTQETTPATSPEHKPHEHKTNYDKKGCCETSNMPPIYQDENVKITYLRQEPCEMTCLSYAFLIENTSDRPLTITFSEVYIDGFKVDLSGLTCENLAIGGKSVETLHLYQQEWEDFTTNPSRVEFRVRLINPKSLLNIYDSDVVTFDL